MSSTSALVVCLLVLAYFGALPTRSRGGDSPAFAAYLALGLLVSPLGLAALDRPLLKDFDPVLRVGAAWLALITGVGPGTVDRRTPKGRGALGMGLAGLVGCGVWVCVDYALSSFTALAADERLWLSAGAAVLASVNKYRDPRGHRLEPQVAVFATRLADLSRASAVLPAGVLVVLSAVAPDHGLASQPLWMRASIAVALGAVLGAIAALLLGREFRRNESWAILLGLMLLGTGVSLRLGFSSVAAMLTMGLTMTALSPHRAEIRALLIPTEPSTLLPLALLAGASILPVDAWLVGVFVGSVLVARLVLELARGTLLRRLMPAPRPNGALVGLSMLSVGGFTLAAAVELNARLPSPVGPALLSLTIAMSLVGEFLGGPATRALLESAGRTAAPTVPTGHASPDDADAGPPPLLASEKAPATPEVEAS